MKKEQEDFATAKNILNGLTGQFGVDKEYLINSIHKLREKKGDNYGDIVILGTQLYSLLIENGLSESDVLNPSRLLDKLNAFLYEEKYDQALEIIEVLDSLEPYRKTTDKGSKVYTLSNEIEAKLMEEHFDIKNPINYVFSRHQFFLEQKAEIYFAKKQNDKALALVKKILDMNPVYFDAYILKAKILKEKDLNKFKKTILEAHKFAFSAQQNVIYLQELSKFYKEKEQFQTAVCILLAVKKYADYSLVEREINNIVKEANKTSIKQFEVPSEEEARRFLQRENIETNISEKNIDAISFAYYDELRKENPNKSFLEYCEKLIAGVSDDKKLVKGIQKVAKEGI